MGVGDRKWILVDGQVQTCEPLEEEAYLTLDLRAHSQAIGDLQAFLALGDGSGRRASGEVAQRIAIETAQTYVAQLLRKAAKSKVRVDPREALSQIFARADHAVNAAAAAAGKGLGASFTAALDPERPCVGRPCRRQSHVCLEGR